jgi:hypothetical protein
MSTIQVLDLSAKRPDEEPNMTMTEEEFNICYKSGEELFRYGSEIMDLKPGMLAYSLCSALARTLITYYKPESLEKCCELKDSVLAALSLEIRRIVMEELDKLGENL